MTEETTPEETKPDPNVFARTLLNGYEQEAIKTQSRLYELDAEKEKQKVRLSELLGQIAATRNLINQGEQWKAS